jgi:tetratricopeptide (TPR) repeat protein
MGSVSKPETNENALDEPVGLPETVPESLAGYRVLRRLGGGELSAVYRAQQSEPERPVALKIVRGGHFIAERHTRLFQRLVQRITRLNHAGIAAVYEIGSIDETLHFFAMELVRGFALDEYARMHKLSAKDRMRMFCAVCDAVAYAHQHGVVHRDLRPDNILINAAGEVRILDFGVALIADTDMERASSYASPEQTHGDMQTSGHCSDIYSLGVILHELLTDRLPASVGSSEEDEVVGSSREEPRARPNGAAGALNSDLSAILHKALDNEPDQRYESVIALADDVRRYLANETVLARRSTPGYRLGKLLKRHKMGFVAGVALCISAAVLLVAGALRTRQAMAAGNERIETISTELANVQQNAANLRAEILAAERLSQEQQKAIDLVRAAEQEQRRKAGVNLQRTENTAGLLAAEQERARKATEFASQVSAVLFGVFKIFESGPGVYHEVTVEGILDRSVEEIKEKLDNHPTMLASLMDSLGMAYQRVGRSDSSIPLLRTALATRRETLGPRHPDTLQTVNNLALLLFAEGRLAEAEPLCRELMESVSDTSGEDHPRTLTAMNNLARLLEAQGKLTEAEPLYRRSLEGRRRVLGEDHPKALACMSNLASVLEASGELSEAVSLCRQVLEGCRGVLGEDHAKTLEAMSDLASMLEFQGKFSEAESLYRDARQAGLKTLPRGHGLVSTAESGLGACLAGQGHHAEAEPLLVNSYKALRSALGEDDDSTARALSRIISLYESWGKPKKAAKFRALRPAQPAVPSSDPSEG